MLISSAGFDVLNILINTRINWRIRVKDVYIIRKSKNLLGEQIHNLIKPYMYKKYWNSLIYISFCRYDSSDDDNYSQAGILYRNILNKDERNRLVENIADNLKKTADFIQVICSLLIFLSIFSKSIAFFFRKGLFINSHRLIVI